MPYTLESRLITFLLTYLVTLASPLVKTGFGIKWDNFTNVIIRRDILSQVSNIRNDGECVSRCLMAEACVSVFYRPQHRRCQLHDVLFMSPRDGKEETGTVYYSLTTGACPPNYVNNRPLSFCYQLHLKQLLYADGNDDCGSRGEHFVVIDSSDKQSHFVKQVTASSDSKTMSYYIDGSDAATEGQWVYHDGRPMTYFAWDPGHPENDTANKDYIAASWTRAFRWRDRIAGQTKYYACEKDV